MSPCRIRGEDIGMLRERSGLSAAEMAALYDVSLPTFYRWERLREAKVGTYVGHVHDCMLAANAGDEPNASFTALREAFHVGGPLAAFRFLDERFSLPLEML